MLLMADVLCVGIPHLVVELGTLGVVLVYFRRARFVAEAYARRTPTG